jgi:hypothetical protein
MCKIYTQNIYLQNLSTVSSIEWDALSQLSRQIRVLNRLLIVKKYVTIYFKFMLFLKEVVIIPLTWVVMFYLHCTTIISLILTFTCKYSAYSSMFIQFYIFWNSAILENNLRDLTSPRAPALQARKRFVLVLLRAFRSATSRKSKACTRTWD